MSSAFISGSNAESTEFAVIFLVTITAGATTLRLCTDAVDFISRGNTFTACGDALEVLPYDDRAEGAPTGKLRLHNLSGAAIQALRQLDPREDALVLIEIVTSDEPDVVQLSWSGAAIREVQYDPLTLDCELTTDNVVGIGTPALSFDPAHFPALHARGSS